MTNGPGVAADVIVVAAGASTRMGGRDKLAADIGGRPLLAWTLAAVAAAPIVERIVVVAGPERVALLERASWLPPQTVGVVPGGERRHESTAAGLRALERIAPAEDDRPVLVHDGARPLVSAELVARVAAAVAEHGAAIPVVPVAETVKRITGDVVETTVDRRTLAIAQTPQGVRRGLLRSAFERFPPEGEPTWTDEAALLEACRISVHAIAGERANIKVTLLDDLARAESALLGQSAERVGFGHDSHPFGPGEPLVLGGIELTGAPRLHGHSDGDVVLHAVADALLGAAALGDLGRMYPAGPSTPPGIGSDVLLRGVVARLAAAGLGPIAIDVTIIGSRPRLGSALDAMRDRIAALLDLSRDRVSVKASSGNLDGMEGAGRGISAEAIARVGTR